MGHIKCPALGSWTQTWESENLSSLLPISLGGLPVQVRPCSSSGPQPRVLRASQALSWGQEVVFWSRVLRKEAGENGSSDPVMHSGPAPSLSSTGPFIGSPISHRGSLRCHSAWALGLARPRPAGGCGQQVGHEGGKGWDGHGGPRHALASRALPWDNGFCPRMHCGAVGEIGGVFMAVFPRTRLRTCHSSMWPFKASLTLWWSKPELTSW